MRNASKQNQKQRNLLEKEKQSLKTLRVMLKTVQMSVKTQPKYFQVRLHMRVQVM